MGIELHFPTEAAPTTSWVPTRQPVFPVGEPLDFEEQIKEETGGGVVYVQDKGVARERFELKFVKIPTADKVLARAFFNAVKKAFNTFEFKDINGVLHTVRWMNEFDFAHVVEGKWSGSIELRKE